MRGGKADAPHVEVAKSKAAVQVASGITVQAIGERYIRDHCIGDDPEKPRRRSHREKARILHRYVYPALGDRPMGSVTRGELIALLDAVKDNHGGVMANRCLAEIRKLYGWAIGRNLIDSSPVVGIVRPGEETKGDRVLSDAEIKEVWGAADKIGYPYGSFVKALLLTGRRRTSVATMRRSELDRKARTWKPTDSSDNKQAPELPLFTALETLLDSIPALSKADADADFIFRTNHRDVAINSFADIKAAVDTTIVSARAKAGIKSAIPPWDLSRDIRRTVKTRLAELKVPKEIRDLIMGHARTGMDAVYDHSERRAEKRAALQKWGTLLAKIVGGTSHKKAA